MKSKGYTLLGLLAVLVVMTVIVQISIELRMKNLRYEQLETTATKVIDVAKAYDLYYAEKCGPSFVIPDINTLGVDISGIGNASNLLLGTFTNSSNVKYLKVSLTYQRSSDAVISKDIFGSGAMIASDKRTVEYFFLPSISLNSQSRKNWFGDVNCF
ncbi:hypothetical protein OCF84_20845 (plasmid) [Shewanella xiamenensis]|uniref:Type II secretion system protein n=1 Tax=Shewanella xiamenensis TaxID=332186 RepID=A0ABT6UGW2_9GAMM|nr:hypothetical protein [Shewanella xiamenensis]MDI5833283.1 hypothetical protein [Shewanella xiamenensis]WHF57967.1 hypothetical protein OCF84_20845 [Shewanella xiamenensis]